MKIRSQEKPPVTKPDPALTNAVAKLLVAALRQNAKEKHP